MKDDSEYVFDWHATLKVRNPAISKAEDWMKAQTAINFVLFSGFKYILSGAKCHYKQVKLTIFA